METCASEEITTEILTKGKSAGCKKHSNRETYDLGGSNKEYQRITPIRTTKTKGDEAQRSTGNECTVPLILI